MKKLIALFVVLLLAAGMTKIHALQGSSVRIYPHAEGSVTEYTEEEFVSVLTGSTWSYFNPVKKNTALLYLYDDCTGIMETMGVSYDMTWSLEGDGYILAVLETDGMEYVYNYRLRLNNGRYELEDTEHRDIIWTPALLF